MHDLFMRIVANAIPIVIAFGLAALSSRMWVRIGRVGAVGLYFILTGAMTRFWDVPVANAVFAFAGTIMLVGDVGGRFGRNATAESRPSRPAG